MDPITNPYAPGAGQRPPELAGRDEQLRTFDVVLERIAVEFEPGRRYDEKEVNVVVGRFFNDYAAIRRYLVDERFLDRDHGVYWRAGGRVDVD